MNVLQLLFGRSNWWVGVPTWNIRSVADTGLMVKPGQFLFLLLVALLVGGAGVIVAYWNDLHTKVNHNTATQDFQVARGERLDQILQDLKERGVLNNTLTLRIYLKITKANPVIRSGSYTFPSPISPLEVLERLKQGGDFGRLTIIEGWTRFEIADALVKIPTLKLKDRKEAMKLFDNKVLIKDLDPKAANLEGYLFPDTYFIDSDSTATELVKQMVGRFREVWSNGLKDQAARKGISAHTVVTAASIIETEAKLKSERPLIASVIENRLKNDIPLGVDSTLIYAAKLAGTWKNDGKIYQSDIDRKSPYNARINKGLPPGPIASPGLSSLQAALNPVSSNFLYYVRNPDRNDGAHNFYSDAKSFEVGVQALRAWEKKHPAAFR